MPLTSGQISAWLLFHGYPATGLMRSEQWRFPAHVREEHVKGAIQEMVARHEALRTTFATDEVGRLEQRVHDFHPVEVEWYDRPPIPWKSISEVVAELTQEPVDITCQWPARWVMGRLTSGDLFLVLMVHHLAMGARGGRVIRQELADVAGNLVDGGSGSAGLSTHLNPRDFVAEELSDRGERTRERARRHIRSVLRGVPSTPFPLDLGADAEQTDAPGESPAGERRVVGELYSPRLRWHVEKLSEEWGVPESAIVLAGLSQVFRRVIPDERGLVWQVYSDRAGPGKRNAACHEPVIGLVRAVEPESPAGAPPREAARAMWAEMLRALRYQAFGETVLVEEIFAESRERGARVQVPFIYNYIAFGGGALWDGDNVALDDEVLDGEKISVNHFDHAPGLTFTCFVRRLPGAFKVSVYLHERLLGDNDLRDLMRCLAEVLNAGPSAEVPALMEPLRRVRPQEDWAHLSGNRWAKPSTVEAELGGLAGVFDARTETITDDEGARLHATVRVHDAGLRAESLRRRSLGLLDVPGFAVPDTVDLVPVATSVDASQAEDSEVRSPSLDALVKALDPLLNSDDWSTGQCYFDAGGELSSVPALLLRLERAGWEGLTWQEICSHRPVRDLATRMRRRS